MNGPVESDEEYYEQFQMNLGTIMCLVVLTVLNMKETVLILWTFTPVESHEHSQGGSLQLKCPVRLVGLRYAESTDNFEKMRFLSYVTFGFGALLWQLQCCSLLTRFCHVRRVV